jgi:hypothetical protein
MVNPYSIEYRRSECGSPENEDDEGNCDCTRCRHSRIKQAKNEYYADRGPDDYDDEHRMGLDELSYEGRQRRAERMIEAADMRRKEIREDALIRSMNKGGDA